MEDTGGDTDTDSEQRNQRLTRLTTSPVKYKHLDSRLFIAGELNVINSKKICEDERICRLSMLHDTVFNMGFYEWPEILKLHAAILTEIESGSKTWNSYFSLFSLLRSTDVIEIDRYHSTIGTEPNQEDNH